MIHYIENDMDTINPNTNWETILDVTVGVVAELEAVMTIDDLDCECYYYIDFITWLFLDNF